MAGRIRTIKPEFVDSESMGRVSRDARLLFILLWTRADDFGRMRGNPTLLAHKLYPYDEDVCPQIEGWLDELEREGCIGRYTVEGSSYLEILHWRAHQKIDHPTPSKMPGIDSVPREDSRGLARAREDRREIREASAEARAGSGSMDLDQDLDLSLLASLGARGGRRVDARTHAKVAPAQAAKAPLAVLTDSPTGSPGAKARGEGKSKAETPAAQQEPLALTGSPPVLATTPREESQKALAARRETWHAYADAYRTRYGVAPLDNAKSRSLIKEFVSRVGQGDAPMVAEWYVTHPGSRYTAPAHSLDMLVKDAEKLRMEWATGRHITTKETHEPARWWATLEGIKAKGQELGLEARPGESSEDFKQRILREHDRLRSRSREKVAEHIEGVRKAINGGGGGR